MRRTTYTIAGQAVAVRVHVVGVSNNVLHLHNDHLGSNSVMSYHSNGSPVLGSRTRYLPFGGYRTAPTQTFTDRGFTGHLHEGGLGLIYMNARFFMPSIGRFASADSIVPDPANTQSFNRYSYGLNNPLKYSDPSGHCIADSQDEYYDYECWQLAYSLRDRLGLSIEFLSTFDLIQLQFFDAALSELGKFDSNLLSQANAMLKDASETPGFLERLRQPGGWDVIGLRGDWSASAFAGLNFSVDLLFNFSALQFSILFNANGTIGFQAGSAFAGGVFIGFNAPTNDAFLGWGSGVTLSGSILEKGFALQYEVSDRFFMLGNLMPERHRVRSTDPTNLTVMYSAGIEAELSLSGGYTFRILDFYFNR